MIMMKISTIYILNDNIHYYLGLCYEEHNGVIELDLDAKIVPTYSFEEIRNQIEEKWKEEIKTKMGDVSKNISHNIKIFYATYNYFTQCKNILHNTKIFYCLHKTES